MRLKLKPTVQIALEWAIRCFTIEHVMNRPIRALRLAEEAVELAQAFDIPKDKMHDLVDIVYGREKGDPLQELGGVAMTLAVMCAAMDLDPDAVFETELRRVLAKSAQHFAKRNEDKLKLGLDAK